jgi:hypothetical protein
MNGIPNLLRNAPRAIGLTLLGNAAQAIVDFLFPTPTWGVYEPGTTVKAFDVSSVAELGIGGESAVSDYPIEDGSFTTYNKIIMPNGFSIRMTRDGSESLRAAFLKWLEFSKNNPVVYDILCPENVYTNATMRSYRINRTASSGAGMIVADCIFQEIRELPAQYSATRISNPENQPVTPTTRVNPVESNVTANVQ